MKFKIVLWLVVPAIALAAAMRSAPDRGAQPPQAPIASTASASVEAKPPTIADVARAAGELPRLHSLLVSHRGNLVLQHYAKGFRATRLANIKSASKSVICASTSDRTSG